MGLFEGLRENGCRVVPILAKPVNLIRTPDIECCSFSARIPGVADSISEIFKAERVPGLVTIEVRDEDALATTRELIRIGFPVGPSSGLNYAPPSKCCAKIRRFRCADRDGISGPDGTLLHHGTVQAFVRVIVTAAASGSFHLTSLCIAKYTAVATELTGIIRMEVRDAL